MEIAHRELAALYDFWDRKRGRRAFPARRDFLPEEFREWMGHIGIVEVEYDPLRFKVRLAGTFIVEYDGRDFTGKYFSQVVPPHGLEAIVAPYKDVIETGQPAYTVLTPDYPGSTNRRMHRLLLPCATDGETIDQFIVGIYVDQWRHGMHTENRDSIYDLMK